MKIKSIILSLLCKLSLFNFCDAQITTANLPNEIKLEDIKNEKITGICYQETKREGIANLKYKSTAFFISRNCLLTSAHNLQTRKGHAVYKIRLYPSKKNSTLPYGKIIYNVANKDYYRKVNRSFFKFRWRKRGHDIALVYIPDSIIEQNTALQNLDYLPILENPTEIQKGETIYCAGYPATGIFENNTAMTMETSSIRNVYNNHFKHRFNTVKGNSGSPIMVKRDNQLYVIGVNSIHNNGTWINTKRLKLIKQWMKELEEVNKTK